MKSADSRRRFFGACIGVIFPYEVLFFGALKIDGDFELSPRRGLAL